MGFVYLRGRQAGALWGLYKEQSSDQKGKRQRQLEENQPCGAHTQEHTCCSVTGDNQLEPPCLPRLGPQQRSSVCTLRRGGGGGGGVLRARVAPDAETASGGSAQPDP